MDDAPKPPSLLAHHVIKQMAEHMFGDTLELRPDDYLVIRTAFRGCKGSWEKLLDGDVGQIELLSKVVTQFGKLKTQKDGGADA